MGKSERNKRIKATSSPSIVAMLLITQTNRLVKPTRGIDCGYEALKRLQICFFRYLFQKWKKGFNSLSKTTGIY